MNVSVGLGFLLQTYDKILIFTNESSTYSVVTKIREKAFNIFITQHLKEIHYEISEGMNNAYLNLFSSSPLLPLHVDRVFLL